MPDDRVTSWKIPALVMAAGAFGGLTSFVLQALAGITPFDKSPVVVIPALFIVGSVAALLGVYLLANSDTSTGNEMVHTLIFALACGVFWQPTFEAARLFVTHSTTQKEANTQKESNQDLSKSLSENSPSLGGQVAQTAEVTTNLVQKLPTVQDPELKAKVVEQSSEAADKIQEAGKKDPDKSIEGLQKIGVAAVQHGQPALAKHVLINLEHLSSQNPQFAAKAKMASSAIITTAQKPAQELSTAAAK
jgi:hypothetical protein